MPVDADNLGCNNNMNMNMNNNCNETLINNVNMNTTVRKRSFEILREENIINISYLQCSSYCVSPSWQLEDYFVL